MKTKLKKEEKVRPGTMRHEEKRGLGNGATTFFVMFQHFNFLQREDMQREE
jgi:hypothetical protein